MGLLYLIRTYSTIKRHGRRGTTTKQQQQQMGSLARKKRLRKKKKKQSTVFHLTIRRIVPMKKKHKTKTPSTIKHIKKPHARCLKKDINEKINCTNDNIIA